MFPSSDTINTTTTSTTVPTISSEFHRRIDVETIDDLRALVDAARRAGQEKIDQCLPRLDNKDNDNDNDNNNNNNNNNNAADGMNGNSSGADDLRVMVEASLRSVCVMSLFFFPSFSVSWVPGISYCWNGEGNGGDEYGSYQKFKNSREFLLIPKP